MNPMPTEPATTYLGHVKNGVIILDAPASLTEGQAVRVEPLPKVQPTPISDERAEQLKRIQALFAQWREEDSSLSDEEGEALQEALRNNRGLSFETPQTQ
ncbi:MAG: hypothetical protein ACRC8S_03260 [Fimbriiglobus sp.]